MTYQQDLHQAHMERRRRLGMVPTQCVKHSTPEPEPALAVAVAVAPEPPRESQVTALVMALGPSKPRPHRVTITMVMNAVAVSFGVRMKDLKSPSRIPAYCRPRQVAMCIARELTPASFPAIGKHFGGRDHTTVLYATKMVPMLAATDPALAEKIETIKEALVACCSPTNGGVHEPA